MSIGDGCTNNVIKKSVCDHWGAFLSFVSTCMMYVHLSSTFFLADNLSVFVVV